ncbi:hypothetical protein [Methylobacterium gossipiicola]|uniref:hypothetical protein n=1 Tax=Methylobacterium gossipiicola TaxID=582675 RepID=UPI0011609470|nr:hypothetical protein [Methylobacterium gossipiicola]
MEHAADDDPAAGVPEEHERLGGAFRQASRQRTSRAAWIGRKLGLALDFVLLSLPVPIVIMLPPVLECRNVAQAIGFFAGDSFEACIQRRIDARWTHLDARIKMIVRGSGQ